MKLTRWFAVAMVLSAIGCAEIGQSMARDVVAQKGQVLREWKQGEEDWMLVREGNRVVEYRINTMTVGISSATQAHAVYAVDQVTQICYAGAAIIPCGNLSRDPNIGPYVNPSYGRRPRRASAADDDAAANAAAAGGSVPASALPAETQAAPPEASAPATVTVASPSPMPTGKVMADVHPLGVEVQFGNGGGGSRAIYKLGLDFAGRIADVGKVGLWLGGEFNIGGADQYAFFEPGLFLKVSFERLLRVPLMPYVKTGVAGAIHVVYGTGLVSSDVTSGGFGFKFGGGFHYFVTRNVGLGAEMDFQFGATVINVAGRTNSSFLGYWDMLAGAEFVF